LVQADATGDRPLVDLCKEYIGKKYHKPGAVFLGLVHRIDRPVSGLVVLARTSKALERMTGLFREKQAKKTYLAILAKRPAKPEDALTHWLQKDPRKNRTTVFSTETPGAQRSMLSYRILVEQKELGRWLLEVNPVTGRPHQIRAQLAFANSPIVGDVKYGYPEPNPDGSICLHARRLEFVHPVKKQPVVFTAPLPETEEWRPFFSPIEG